MEVQTLSRRDKERLARSRAILDAALDTFAEKGYDGATLDELAERAEFGKGTLYNYFPGGKEEILFALFDEVYDGVVELTNEYFAIQASEELPARDVFRDYTARMIAHFIDRLPNFLLLVKEAHRMVFGEKREHATHLFAQRERVAAAIAKPIQRAIDRGQIKPLDAHVVAHLIMGNIHGYLMFACPLNGESDNSPDPEQGAEFITTILFDGLLTNTQ